MGILCSVFIFAFLELLKITFQLKVFKNGRKKKWEEIALSWIQTGLPQQLGDSPCHFV